MSNRKAHGGDGIPGEAYKETRKWAIEPIAKIATQIKDGQEIPENWTNGRNSVHIQELRWRKRMRGIQTNMPNANYIQDMVGTHYKKLTKIMHILTRNNQYGYRAGISTSDAIIKMEQYVEHANRGDKIPLMDLSMEFDTINRTLQLTTLYKKGLRG